MVSAYQLRLSLRSMLPGSSLAITGPSLYRGDSSPNYFASLHSDYPSIRAKDCFQHVQESHSTVFDWGEGWRITSSSGVYLAIAASGPSSSALDFCANRRMLLGLVLGHLPQVPFQYCSESDLRHRETPKRWAERGTFKAVIAAASSAISQLGSYRAGYSTDCSFDGTRTSCFSVDSYSQLSLWWGQLKTKQSQ